MSLPELKRLVAATQMKGGDQARPIAYRYTKNSLGGAPTERRTMAVKALGLA